MPHAPLACLPALLSSRTREPPRGPGMDLTVLWGRPRPGNPWIQRGPQEEAQEAKPPMSALSRPELGYKWRSQEDRIHTAGIWGGRPCWGHAVPHPRAAPPVQVGPEAGLSETEGLTWGPQ